MKKDGVRDGSEREIELNDEQRGRENRDTGETRLFSALQAQPVPSISRHVKSKQAGQSTVSTSEKKREAETDRGMRETCGQTELLPSDVPDGPI